VQIYNINDGTWTVKESASLDMLIDNSACIVLPNEDVLVVGSEKYGPYTGLPDGLFSKQKSQFGQKFEGLRLENIDLLYGHLEYFKDIWDFLRPFGTFSVHRVYLFRFWNHASRKIWQPWPYMPVVTGRVLM
jgi:hypothetical protein